VDGGRSGKAQADRLADRARPRRGGGAPGALLSCRSLVLGALGQGPDPDDQQNLQRLAYGRRLARQITDPLTITSNVSAQNHSDDLVIRNSSCPALCRAPTGSTPQSHGSWMAGSSRSPAVTMIDCLSGSEH